MFGVTAVITVAFVIWGAAATDSLESASSKMLNGLIHNGGWAFMLAASCFVVFALWIAISLPQLSTAFEPGGPPSAASTSAPRARSPSSGPCPGSR